MDTELHEQRNERRRIKVIDCATQLFQSKGVREVTMDDIAGALRISKRTLYQMFRGKEELVLACVKAGIEADQRRRLEIETDTADALERLFRNIECKLIDLRNLHPDYAKDIRRYTSVRTFLAVCREDLITRVCTGLPATVRGVRVPVTTAVLSSVSVRQPSGDASRCAAAESEVPRPQSKSGRYSGRKTVMNEQKRGPEPNGGRVC